MNVAEQIASLKAKVQPEIRKPAAAPVAVAPPVVKPAPVAPAAPVALPSGLEAIIAAAVAQATAQATAEANAKIAALQAEVQAAKSAPAERKPEKRVWISEKGCMCVRNRSLKLRCVALYGNEWAALLSMADEIKAFLEENKGQVKAEYDRKTAEK